MPSFHKEAHRDFLTARNLLVRELRDSKDYSCLRALDSISLLRYVVTTQMQFDFRFSSTARSVRLPNFTLVIVFSVRIFFQSQKRVLQ